jgi:hypothetical protein
MKIYRALWLQLYLVPVIAAGLFYDKVGEGLKGFFLFGYNFLKFVFLFVLFLVLDRPDERNALVWGDVYSPLNISVLFLFLGGIAYFIFYQLFLFVMAQFVLPVTEWPDRKKAYARLALYARGKHGLAVFVKGGVKIARDHELESSKPGVALVDLSSAVVLVQHDDIKSMSLPSEDEWQASHSKPAKTKKGKTATSYEPKEPEAKGPGVVFTEKGQKIDDVVDLRKQTRTTDFLEVYTRNGIKVKSKVTVVFSLSDTPEKVFVGYVGGKNLTDLKILKVSQSDTELTINGGVSVDVDDAIDILRASLPLFDEAPSNPFIPHAFDSDRVLRAVFNQARDRDGKLIPWHRAPLEAAADIFRKMMSDVPYDRFFSGDLLNLTRREEVEENDKNDKNSVHAFLAGLKEDFALKVKARGLMTFQFIEHLNGDPFSYKETVSLDFLRKQTPVTLTREKFNFFRHMGIVVKSASFSDVQASSPEIQEKMLEAWKAKMERAISTSNAEYELEAIRVRNRSRALAQEEMTHLLSGIFQSTPHFDEALALRVLQALETSVADSDMSSADLHEILKNIHDWLLVDQQDDKGGGPKNPPLPNSGS